MRCGTSPRPEAPMSVLSSASHSKPKERPAETASPARRGSSRRRRPLHRHKRRPRQERRKPQNAEGPEAAGKARRKARPAEKRRARGPRRKSPRAPRPAKSSSPPLPHRRDIAPAPEAAMEEKIEKFLTALLTHMNSTAVPHAYRTEEGGYRAELVGGDVGMLDSRPPRRNTQRHGILDELRHRPRQRDARARQRLEHEQLASRSARKRCSIWPPRWRARP